MATYKKINRIDFNKIGKIGSVYKIFKTFKIIIISLIKNVILAKINNKNVDFANPFVDFF